MTTDESTSEQQYHDALSEYLTARNEAALYQASLLGQHFVEHGMGPDEIIALHAESLEQAVVGLPYRQKAVAGVDALQFLLDVMIAYGVHYKQYLELRMAERTHAAEAETRMAKQRAADAERADQEKSDILASIAHELRTPLTAARGQVDLALRSLERGQLVNQVPVMLAGTRRALDRMARLATDLVDASRGAVPPMTLRPLDLAEVVAQACGWATESASQKPLDLTYQPPTEPISVLGDGDALLSVFGNLLSNAIRYTPPNGRVTVKVAVAGKSVIVAVADTGVGMPPEVQAHIFDKFYRAPSARAAEASGLGIGLTLARQIVKAHDGNLTVESTPGAGSTFRVTLPIHTGDGADKETDDG